MTSLTVEFIHMNAEKTTRYICEWLKRYAENASVGGFVIGISGGIDSSVTSTLCAMTGKRTLALNMPIHQSKHEYDRGHEHITWLMKKYPNVESAEVDLTPAFDKLAEVLPKNVQDFLTMANTRSRLRMLTLYAFASRHQLLVTGTGNKIEDFGIGFFTKYGDGGVDISPIADLTKTQVYQLGKHLDLPESVQSAHPTDGLFADGRTDEDQIGATYPELEWAMDYIGSDSNESLTARQKHVLEIYKSRHAANKHKMSLPPVCTIPPEFLK